jgi:hypothetical protein
MAERSRMRYGGTMRSAFLFTLTLLACGGRLEGGSGSSGGSSSGSKETGSSSGSTASSSSGSGSSSGNPAAPVYCDVNCGLTPYGPNPQTEQICPAGTVCFFGPVNGRPSSNWYQCCWSYSPDCVATSNVCEFCTVPQPDGGTCMIPADGTSTTACGSACVCSPGNPPQAVCPGLGP